MPWATIAIASGIGSAVQGYAAGEAGKSQANAANNAADLQYRMFLQNQANLQPWMLAGQNALSQLGAFTGPGGSMSAMPTAQDIMTQMAPNYQFQLAQGMGQAGNQMNASGGLMSGNEAQGLNQFAQNFAGNAYQNAFSNYQTAQGNIFNRLATIAGMGQGAAGGIMNAGMNTASNMGNLQTSAAAANAAGQVGQANAFSGMLGNIGSMYMLNKMGAFGRGGSSNPWTPM